jgi:hypothetical protein
MSLRSDASKSTTLKTWDILASCCSYLPWYITKRDNYFEFIWYYFIIVICSDTQRERYPFFQEQRSLALNWAEATNHLHCSYCGTNSSLTTSKEYEWNAILQLLEEFAHAAGMNERRGDSGASNTVCIKKLDENGAKWIDQFKHHDF